MSFHFTHAHYGPHQERFLFLTQLMPKIMKPSIWQSSLCQQSL